MSDASETSRRILVVDLYSGGHHAQYIEQLLRYRPEGCGLQIAVTGALLEHSAVLREAERTAGGSVEIVRIENPHIVNGGGTADLIRNDLEHGRIVRRLVEKYRPGHCLLMYFDHVQLSLALNLRFDHDVGISGIYFRPTFHYGSLTSENRPFRARIVEVRKQVLLRGALRNPHLSHVFSLDPFAAAKINEWKPQAIAVPLPDGADIAPPSLSAVVVREEWSVEEGRHVALLFGVIDSRKGVFEVLAALERLDRSDQQRLCMALVGPRADHERSAIDDAVARATDRTAVQLVIDDRFIQQQEIQNLLHASDSVVLTYQHHVGSSNVLVRAAAAKKPVIGTDYGLVGAYIRQHRLGLAIDATDSSEIASALSVAISGSMANRFDSDEAARFASGHSAERFAATIYDAVINR